MPQIHQEITFTATPAAVYRALTDAAAFAQFTGMPADAVAHLDAGWGHKYWEPLRRYLEA